MVSSILQELNIDNNDIIQQFYDYNYNCNYTRGLSCST